MQSHVFISYNRKNSALIDRLCLDLRRAGVEVWLDREKIVTGQNWKQAIREAIDKGAFFIACFSPESVQQVESIMHEEVLLAIERKRRRRADRPWFIPIKIAPCDVPNLDIGGGETLHDINTADMFPDWHVGVARILEALRLGGAALYDSTEPSNNILFDDYKVHYQIAAGGTGAATQLTRTTRYQPKALKGVMQSVRPSVYYELFEMERYQRVELRVFTRGIPEVLLYEKIGRLEPSFEKPILQFRSDKHFDVPARNLTEAGPLTIEFVERMEVHPTDRDHVVAYVPMDHISISSESNQGEFEFSVGDSPFLEKLASGNNWHLNRLLPPREVISVRWFPAKKKP